MHIIDYGLLALVVLILAFAGRRTFSRKKRGSCHGCAGCCETCRERNCSEKDKQNL